TGEFESDFRSMAAVRTPRRTNVLEIMKRGRFRSQITRAFPISSMNTVPGNVDAGDMRQAVVRNSSLQSITERLQRVRYGGVGAARIRIARAESGRIATRITGEKSNARRGECDAQAPACN